jgi:small nuclear ribonucleoprotein D3
MDTEDNMNLQLKDITLTQRDGKISQLEQVFIRGSQIKFIIVPDMLKNAPMFKKFGKDQSKISRAMGIGRGRLTMQRVAAARGRITQNRP